MDKELCPRQPKSVCTKAEDLEQNLPDWLAHVAETGGAADPRAHEACTGVRDKAAETIARLRDLVDTGVTESEHAADALVALMKTVHGAIALLLHKEEFKAATAPSTNGTPGANGSPGATVSNERAAELPPDGV